MDSGPVNTLQDEAWKAASRLSIRISLASGTFLIRRKCAFCFVVAVLLAKEISSCQAMHSKMIFLILCKI